MDERVAAIGEVRGYSALDTGLAVFSTGVFQLMAIPLFGFLAARFDFRWILMAGLALFAISMWSFSSITHDWGSKELLLPQAFRGLAQQLSVAPTVTLALGSLAPQKLKLASGLFNLMRNLGGAIGIAACATVLNDRTNLHMLRLAEHLNSTNESLNALIASRPDTLEQASPFLAQLWARTFREALTLTFADTFLLIMVIFLVAIALVPLLKKATVTTAPPQESH